MASSSDIQISFVDASFTVPRYAAETMHRVNLLLREHPEATDFHFQELEGGRFKRALEESSVPIIDVESFRPTKAKKLIENTETLQFFEFMFGVMIRREATVVLNGFVASTHVSCVPIDSCIEDVMFSLTKFKSKRHNTQFIDCLMCPQKWWIEHAGSVLEHSFMTKVDPRKHSANIIASRVEGYTEREMFICMYAALYPDSYSISVNFTFKEIVDIK